MANLSRRGLLGAGLAGLTAAVSSQAPFNVENPVVRLKRRPKNIIFVVFDGMGVQCPTIAHHFQQMMGKAGGDWQWLMDLPETKLALQDTRSLNCVVTDSSAAASTWGSGRRIFNGMTNMYPDGTKLRTLVQLMHAKRVKCGLVTTTTITHATPTGFALNCIDRDLQPLMAEMYPESGVDVVMGGGNNYIAADLRSDKKDAYEGYRRAGFQIVRTRDEMRALRTGKVLGVFADSHLPYTIDRRNDAKLRSNVPTLAELTTKAIELLDGGPNGFLLQVEAGRVDHANHGNDCVGMLYDQIEGEAALRAAVEFAMRDGDTLVIATADHACGGVALNGAGSEYEDANTGLLKLKDAKGSASSISAWAAAGAKLGKLKAADIQDKVEDVLKVQLTEEEALYVKDAAYEKTKDALPIFRRGLSDVLGVVLANHYKIGFTSGNHTNDAVPVLAWGPGSENIHGLIKNTWFNTFILATKDIQHKNPLMTYAEAREHYDKMKKAIDPDWYEMYAAHEECACHG
ncbi:MAG: alkaline phosphatase [Chthonomonas sp.]|nr:alkaline phosphatase [Chthonomonas sp.]